MKGELTLAAHLQSAVSVKPQNISYDGCGVDVRKALDQDRSRQGGIKYPVISERSVVNKLLCGPSYDGEIDMPL